MIARCLVAAICLFAGVARGAWWSDDAWNSFRMDAPFRTSVCAGVTSVVLTNYAGTNAVITTNTFLNDITAPPCSGNPVTNVWTYALTGPTGQTISVVYTVTNTPAMTNLLLGAGNVQALQSYLALYERWIASGETPVDAGPNNQRIQAPRFYRDTREALVDWKECASRLFPMYVDRTGIETNDATLPYVRTLSAAYVCEWLGIPTNYFNRTPWRQLNGLGIARTSEWVQVGYSELDYGWKYVTNIVPLMTWTYGKPERRANLFPRSNSHWSITSYIDFPTYEEAQENAKSGYEESDGYSRGGGATVLFWAQAIYYAGDPLDPYVAPAQAAAVRGHFTAVTSTNLECRSALYCAATSAVSFSGVTKAFYPQGFNLVESVPSLVTSAIKPAGTNAVTLFFDPTRGRGVNAVDGHWPPDPATIEPSENGASYSSHGFQVTNWWVIHKWDATPNGFRYR